jgi:hypothetical protein
VIVVAFPWCVRMRGLSGFRRFWACPSACVCFAKDFLEADEHR